MEIASLFTNSGFSLMDLAEHLPKIQKGFEMVKDKLPLIKEYEKTLNLKDGEILMYSALPIITQTKTEILIVGLVVSRNDRGESVIVREAFKIEGLAKITELMSYIPQT